MWERKKASKLDKTQNALEGWLTIILRSFLTKKINRYFMFDRLKAIMQLNIVCECVLKHQIHILLLLLLIFYFSYLIDKILHMDDMWVLCWYNMKTPTKLLYYRHVLLNEAFVIMKRRKRTQKYCLFTFIYNMHPHLYTSYTSACSVTVATFYLPNIHANMGGISVHLVSMWMQNI